MLNQKMLNYKARSRAVALLMVIAMVLPMMVMEPRHGYSMSTMKSWVNWIWPGTFPDPESEANKKKAPEPSISDQPRTDSLTETERKILLSLMKRKRELDQRDTLLNQEEETLRAIRDNIQQQQAELKKLQFEIEASMDAKRQQDAENLKKVVDLYNSMDPKRAAEKLQTLEPKVAMKILMGMKKRRAAEVMEELPPDNAKLITESIVSKVPVTN